MTTTQPDATATTEAADGHYRGVVHRDVVTFHGVPYAAAPIAEHRLAEPRPRPSPNGLVDATLPGPVAPQVPVLAPVGDIFGAGGRQSEDCLSLNIRTPGLDGGPRPVLVFIHGGGFFVGSGSHPLHGDGTFAREGIVEVTVSYRLGVLGFGYVPGAPAPANRGLLDVVTALEWVQRNIAAFGGDPKRVTAAGQSAGAMLVAALLTMPRAQGLFSGAILQSGAGENAIAPSVAEGVTRHTMGASQDLASAIVEAPVEKLLKAQKRVANQMGRGTIGDRFGEHLPAACPWQPVVDDDTIRDLPVRLIAGGSGGDVPVLSGATRDEGWLTVGSKLGAMPLPKAVLPRLVSMLTGLSGDRAKEHVEAYRSRLPGRKGARVVADIAGDLVFRAPAMRLAEARAEAVAPTFDYVLDAPDSVVRGQSATLHGSDLPYLFDSLETPPGRRLAGQKAHVGLGDNLRALWRSFIENGAPTQDRAEWPDFRPSTRSTAVLGTDGITVVSDVDGDRRNLWD